MLRRCNLFLFFFVVILVSASAQEARIFKGKDAQMQFPAAEMLQTEHYTHVPTFITFRQDAQIVLEEFPALVKKQFKLGEEYGWKTKQSTADELGFIHQRLTQTYKGYPIEGATYLVHSKNGFITSLNGDAFNDLSIPTQVSISEERALELALESIKAELYAWEAEGMAGSHEAEFQEMAHKPRGQLVIAPVEGRFFDKQFRLAYKFDIYALTPLSRNYMYVDAQTGEIIWKSSRIHTADTPGTANTKYSGNRSIISDSFTGGYRLRESGRGGGIRTRNLQTGTNAANAIDFTDSDNVWNNVNAAQDEAATDAHWAAEMTYDFYMNNFNRNAIDGNGGIINCYMHYDVDYFNAFWDGSAMFIGDGNNNNALASVDIIGHEMTHGVTQFTANLVYQDEPGGLNESFSDVFGTAIEMSAKPGASWDMGSDIGTVIRSMSNPKQYNDPDTYQGQYWVAAGGADNGGVHTNSGVQNYWFYLLCQGGSGTNDNNTVYNISPIGITPAAAIAYRSLSVYLTDQSQYSDARTFSIQAAIDLYGPCTNEVITVTNAWNAVGVGGAFVQAVTADFSVPTTVGCQVPFTVQFANASTNAGTFSWNFGDGGTSTANSPTHTYTSFGVYNVSLFSNGGPCGSDTEVKNSYINISPSNPCIVVMNTTNTLQTSCAGKLFDTGGSNDYSNNTDATITIAPTGASTVTLDFVSFDYETDYDYLYIYDGATINSPLIGKYTGQTLPNGGTITSTGGSITIRQTTDPGVVASGFEIDWICTVPNAPPVTNFQALSTSSCNGMIDFIDISSQGPTAWAWNFGDGGTSTLQNPSHTYTQSGTYTVTLTTTNSFGNDAETKTAYITINLPAAPTIASTYITIPSNTTATMTGTAGSGATIHWYNSAQVLVGTGNSYTTPPLLMNATYYAQNVVPAPPTSGGPVDNTFGAGGNFTNPVRHLKFDVNQNCTLKSVKAYAQGGGNRTIEHRDATGTILNDTIVYLNDGMNVVVLNFPLTVGNQFELGVNPNIQNPNLYRNSTNANFPYNIGNYASITGTDATSPSYYYFFYDWKIEGETCISEQVAIDVVIATSIGDALENGTMELFPNPGNGSFTLDFDLAQPKDIQFAVYNMMGQTMYQSETVFTDSYQYKVLLPQLAAGTYMVQAKVGNQIVYRKYIVE